MKTPKVSVVMPVYNAGAYIKSSVESILNQTFGDFEFIILDDQSTDNSLAYLQSLSDPRIRLMTHPAKKGLSERLNQGFALAQGEYIARMDADDVCERDRLAKQVTFMDEHPDYICCGCNYIEIPSGKKSQLPETDEEIRVGLFSNSQFAHPTVMLRRSMIEKHKLSYDAGSEPVEDYKFWLELAPYGKFFNLPGYLLQYRKHKDQVSSPANTRQQLKARQLATEYTGTFANGHPDSEIFALCQVKNTDELQKYNQVEKIIRSRLLESGFRSVGKILAERKKNAIKRGLTADGRSLHHLKFFISSGVFLGLKFYISLILNRHIPVETE